MISKTWSIESKAMALMAVFGVQGAMPTALAKEIDLNPPLSKASRAEGTPELNPGSNFQVTHPAYYFIKSTLGETLATAETLDSAFAQLGSLKDAGLCPQIQKLQSKYCKFKQEYYGEQQIWEVTVTVGSYSPGWQDYPIAVSPSFDEALKMYKRLIESDQCDLVRSANGQSGYLPYSMHVCSIDFQFPIAVEKKSDTGDGCNHSGPGSQPSQPGQGNPIPHPSPRNRTCTFGIFSGTGVDEQAARMDLQSRCILSGTPASACVNYAAQAVCR